MPLNESLANGLESMARLMDLLGEDSFKSAAHARAARVIADLPGDVAALASDRPSLLALPGIGPKMADKIIEFVTTGRIAEHEALLSQVPPGLLALLEVPGLGPKTVRTLWQQGGVTNLTSLERIIADGSILALPRMGAKAVEKIKANLTFAKSAPTRLWLGRAWTLAETFLARVRDLPGVAQAQAAGSLRRGRDTVGDIDLLVALRPGYESSAHAVGEAFRGAPDVAEVLAAGDTKSSVRVALNHDAGRWKHADGAKAPDHTVQVDLRVVPVAAWGAALLYFTGSKAHNIRLRERALSKGLTLSEWGLFPHDGDATPPHTRGITPVAADTEAHVYAALGLPWIPPEAREDHGETDMPGPWALVDLADIKAELHAHTTASDGLLTIRELAEEAKRRGFHTIAVTDHSQSSSIANGLKPDRLRRHLDAVRKANDEIDGITILAGSEVDILADGSLDYDDELLARLDIVVASPHAALSQDSTACTERLLRAVRHPLVHILGHPTGRLINRRKGLEPDMAALIAAAKEHDTALEINAHWMRLDLRDTHVRQAMNAGCLIAVNTDAHAREDFDNLRFGVMTARRGWVTPDRCLNTWPATKLHAWLKRKGR
ncbi:MAG: DNA polymerase/3'-5' exonuclease PolX [Phycisphaerae bacterium]|nr:MAG: DNA polymerase/3'-5' exonuclease PolX [Phycisphaerae bacterium]